MLRPWPCCWLLLRCSIPPARLRRLPLAVPCRRTHPARRCPAPTLRPAEEWAPSGSEAESEEDVEEEGSEEEEQPPRRPRLLPLSGGKPRSDVS